MVNGAFSRADFTPQGRPAIFVDRDGTIVDDLPQGRLDVAADELRGPASQLLLEAKKNGIPVFLVTNQPAIAKGRISESDVYRVHNRIQELLVSSIGECFDEIVFCPHHPESGHEGEIAHLKTECMCRKPRAGMLYDLAKRHNLDLVKSLVVGDSQADHLLAKNVGASFIIDSKIQDIDLAEWLAHL